MCRFVRASCPGWRSEASQRTWEEKTKSSLATFSKSMTGTASTWTRQTQTFCFPLYACNICSSPTVCMLLFQFLPGGVGALCSESRSTRRPLHQTREFYWLCSSAAPHGPDTIEEVLCRKRQWPLNRTWPGSRETFTEIQQPRIVYNIKNERIN